MMNDVALAAMEMSSARLETQYAMSLQKRTMTDMEPVSYTHLTLPTN